MYDYNGFIPIIFTCIFFRESNEEVIGHIYNASEVPGKLLRETKGKGEVNCLSFLWYCRKCVTITMYSKMHEKNSAI